MAHSAAVLLLQLLEDDQCLTDLGTTLQGQSDLKVIST